MALIPLTQNRSVIVDDEMFEMLNRYKWNLSFGKYAGGWVNGKQVLMHRFIMKPRFGFQVDHINNNTLDCRKENLRVCTPSQNIARVGPRRNNKLGILGVSRKFGKFRAVIRVAGNQHHLGTFDTGKDAAGAYNKASSHFFGEFGYQNDLEAIKC